ncbi:MAG: S-layer homology domain-containing protein [Snowella sp.]|nr:S-layer homology domain-containing protein [Snowella sp.]
MDKSSPVGKMIKKVALVVGLFSFATLTGCSGSQFFENRLAADPSLQNSPNATVTSTDTPSPSVSAENLPDEIPRYYNATLEKISPDATRDRGQTRWSSIDPMNAITVFYERQFRADGWEILSREDNPNRAVTAQKNGLQVTVTPFTEDRQTRFTLDYLRTDSTTQSAQPSPNEIADPNRTTTNEPVTFDDINQISQPLQGYIQDLGNLGVISPKTGNNFQANTPITRREYARWLVAANNQFYATSPGKQIRLGDKNSSPAFSDVPATDPDFPSIQGLAEAGLIPSPLTNDSSAILFRPDTPLKREELIAWKVPLDTRKALPTASIDNLKETWGFQDTAKIDPKSWRAIYGDFQNGEQANIRRVFGYTTLLQPKKSVTRSEAAAALWYFGFQGDGFSASDALGIKNTTASPNVPNS